MIKKTKLAILIGLMITSAAIAQTSEDSEIKYQSESSVNAAPQSKPQGVSEGQSDNGTNTSSLQGQVENERREGKNDITKKPNYSQMSDVQRFWNIKNEEIRNIQRKYESKVAALDQDVNPSSCDKAGGLRNITNSPGADLPLIRLDGRNIATILMTDVYNNPWSIDYVINDDNAIKVITDENNPENSSLTIQSLNRNGSGTFVVKLKDNPVPVVFQFVSGQKKIDCFITAKLDKPSPNANIKTESISTSAMDGSLNSTLYGVAPKDSKKLKTSSDAVTAWQTKDGKVVLRTKYKLLSPAYESVVRSPDGTFVYKTQLTSTYRYRYNDVIGSFNILR